MYHYNLGPSLRQRFEQNKKKGLRHDSAERFSSFQSPPPSDHELQEFSDYQSPPKEKIVGKTKKQKSYILVEQLPLQYQSAGKKKKQKDNSKQQKMNESISCDKTYSYPHPQKAERNQRKQNAAIKFNYLQQISKQLSTIKQDQREYLRESTYASHWQRNLNRVLPIPTPFSPPITHPHYPSYNYLIDEEIQIQNRIVIEEQKLRAEELKLKNALLQQQNITLKEKIFYLQSQLRKKSYASKQCESISPKVNKIVQQELQSTRKQAKQKLLDQIANLQARCNQMKEEMIAYKLKQEERLSNLLKEQQTKKQIVVPESKQQIVVPEGKQQMDLQSANQYYAKFVEVFLNMVQKLPFKLEPTWSKKKKIAVGWKIVKHYVRKALKLGILAPTIIQREDLQ